MLFLRFPRDFKEFPLKMQKLLIDLLVLEQAAQLICKTFNSIEDLDEKKRPWPAVALIYYRTCSSTWR